MMKPECDIDRDSAMGLSVFTGGKSTTLSEVSLSIPHTHYTNIFTVLWQLSVQKGSYAIISNAVHY